MKRGVLDTSVLVGKDRLDEVEGAISAISIAELHFGVLVATDSGERARRVQRLAVIEATFDPLPLDAAVSREWGRLAAAVRQRGGSPRKRAMDLAIAATANVHRASLITQNTKDFKIIDDLVDLIEPSAAGLWA